MVNPIHILWIDPDYPAIALHIETLQHEGFSIDHVGSAAQAFALAKRSTYDVAIIELVLSDALGTDVWRGLSKRHRNMVAIITTAIPSLYKNVKPSPKRLLAYLLKPIQPDILKQLIVQANTGLINPLHAL